jgi:hypothetical protein
MQAFFRNMFKQKFFLKKGLSLTRAPNSKASVEAADMNALVRASPSTPPK